MNSRHLFVPLLAGAGLALGVSALLASGPAAAAPAGTIIVTNANDSGAGSLRQAILDANDGDTVDFALTTPATIALTSGALDVTESITIAGPGADQLAVSGSNASAVFNVTGAAVTLSDLAVTRGRSGCGGGVSYQHVTGTLVLSDVTATDNFASNGGALYVYDGTAIVRGGQFISNTAFNGGAVYLMEGTLTQTGGIVGRNTASGYGGGLHAWESAVVLGGVQIVSNTAAFDGGGVYVYSGTVTLVGGQVADNRAVYGGGLLVEPDTASLDVVSGEIRGNRALWGGGGVRVWEGRVTMSGGRIISNTAGSNDGGGVEVHGGDFTLAGGEIVSNTALNGGGIHVTDGAFTQTGGTIAGNTASLDGGGLYAESSSVTLSPAEIRGNWATNGAGLYAGTSAVVVYGPAEIHGSRVAKHAGASTCKGDVTMEGGRVVSNTASLDGGGFALFCGTAALNGGQVAGNSAQRGGGLYVQGAVVLDGGEVVGNSASTGGGGLRLVMGQATLSGGRVAGNSSPWGSALCMHGTGAAVSTTAPLTLSGDVYVGGRFDSGAYPLRIEGDLWFGGGTFDAPSAFTLTGSFTHTGGTYRQTRDVVGSGPVGFPKAGGVIVDANGQGDLGSTEVVIHAAAQGCCVPMANPTVWHYYGITPTLTTNVSATITFYFWDCEIPPGQSCDALDAWHWGVGLGAMLETEARQCSSEPYWLQATNTVGFSSFVLRGFRYGISLPLMVRAH